MLFAYLRGDVCNVGILASIKKTFVDFRDTSSVSKIENVFEHKDGGVVDST